MKTIVVIPARYHSVRFPGKILAPIKGKAMIRHVIDGVKESDKVDEIYVATDNEAIATAVLNDDVKVIKTSTEHNSGTERIIEAVENIDTEWDFLINVQGDEPLISGHHLEGLIEYAVKHPCDVVTLARKESSLDKVKSPNVVKVTFDGKNIAHYFSRALIPYPRNEVSVWYQHIGVYGFRKNAFEKISKLAPSPLEMAESLEQLRWIDNGMRIGVAITDTTLRGVDVPEDVVEVEKLLELRENRID